MYKKILLLGLAFLLSTLEARENSSFVKAKAENLRYSETIREFIRDDKQMADLLHKSYAHVVFPSIGKGGLILGYASGEGRAYTRGGIWIGNVTVTQYSVGLEIGGEVYREIIFFKTRKAFDKFKEGGLVNSTQVSLVPFISGLSGDVNFANGVKVYTSSIGGFMIDASTGAQSFEYTQAMNKNK